MLRTRVKYHLTRFLRVVHSEGLRIPALLNLSQCRGWLGMVVLEDLPHESDKLLSHLWIPV